MNHRPIGIFDSGLGGLTVVREIEKALPNESYVYVGDTARVPYGNRSPETVKQFSLEIAKFLFNHQVKAIVVACATASSVALDFLKSQFPSLPILGVIDAGAKDAVTNSPNGKIGIIGTRATINSRSFEIALKNLNPHVSVQSLACPLFVPIIEEGISSGPILDPVLDFYLDSKPQFKTIDSLILGCTHYPIISDAIQKILPNTKLINVGLSLAHNLKTLLLTDKNHSNSKSVNHRFYATDLNGNFISNAKLFLGRDVQIEHTDLKS